MNRFEREAAADMERAVYLARTIDELFRYVDPGMRLDPIRSDLIAANLPITPEGEAIVESDDV